MYNKCITMKTNNPYFFIYGSQCEIFGYSEEGGGRLGGPWIIRLGPSDWQPFREKKKLRIDLKWRKMRSKVIFGSVYGASHFIARGGPGFFRKKKLYSDFRRKKKLYFDSLRKKILYHDWQTKMCTPFKWGKFTRWIDLDGRCQSELVNKSI